MRIKRLQLAGFKSCMERTVLEFPRGVTGIVGPNGCGKSNIVDALRWVLGEQSARHLRGQVMEDVIFAGNDRFAPLGFAEVSITLDHEGPLPTGADDENGEPSPIVAMLKDATEIEVTRRLFRSGESEYMINGRPCRLRDITELFLGTGVGSKAYSIIEQGRVGQIVNAKPEELRLFIEEAAGTTLYRARKLTAERKIERTRNNLLRVSDIVGELERQVGSLRRQVRGAVRYRELKIEEDRLDRALSSLRFARLRERLDALACALGEKRSRETTARESVRRATTERDAARARQDDAMLRADEARRTYYEARGGLTALIQEKQFLEQRVRDLAGSMVGAEEDLKNIDDKLLTVHSELKAAETQRQDCMAEAARIGESRSSREAELAEREKSLAAATSELEIVRETAISLLADEARLGNEQESLTRQRQTIAVRLEGLRDEAGSLATVMDRLGARLEQGRGRLDELVAQIKTTTGGKNETTATLRTLLGRRGELERLVDQRRADASVLESRFSSLQELSESFAGYDEGVRTIMRNGAKEATGATAVIADVIDIEPGYERAVAAALSDSLQYVVVNTADEGVRGANYLRDAGAGRASFIPLSLRGSNHDEGDSDSGLPQGFSWLTQHVRPREGYEVPVSALLAGIAVANDLEVAVARWRTGDRPVTFVTRGGEVLQSSGIVTGGAGKPLDEGILARKAELRGIRIKLVDAEVKAREAKAAFEQLLRETEAASKAIAHLDRRLHELTVTRVEIEGELELEKQNLSRTEDRARAVATEIEALTRDEVTLTSRFHAGRDRFEQIAEERRHVEQRIRDIGEMRQRLEGDRDGSRSGLSSVQVREAELAQQQHALAMRVESLRERIRDLETRRAIIEERQKRDQAEVERAQRRLGAPDFDVERLEDSLKVASLTCETIDAETSEVRAELSRREDQLSALVAELDAAREERAQLELSMKECELERASAEEALRERLGIGEADLVAHASAVGPDEDSGGAELVEELERVRASIRRLGMVNVGAVTELEEIEQRLAELISQRSDLERSIDDLRGTIARLNRLSRQRFRDTFESVNQIFQETFPRLFQGGKAWLTLTDEADLLETGVEIFVQPPGKKLGNINLLSGGEKALTAVSLIFSLFLHKPSPFCVLDEVDAPLDDANIGRFARIVDEMSERSQFLLITHNKKTMEGCDTLYGVTMREPGVSKIVSVEMSH